MTTDSERLDFLQVNELTVYRVEHHEWRYDTTGSPSRKLVTVFDGWSVNDPDNPKATYREAIDAAMQQEKIG